MARRPLYFVAKKEAFINRLAAWLLSSLGAYPIDRGSADQEAMATTRAILAARRRRADLPRGHAHAARARWAGRSAASGAWRWRPAPP